MKNTIILIIKGVIIGIGKILPGVSGAILAISLNVYDKGLDAITNFFNNVKKNTSFLIKLGTGILIGLIFFSKIIKYFIINYENQTIALFIGLIIGGIPILFKEIKNKKHYLYLVISFILIMLLSLININNNKTNLTFIDLLISGFVEAFSTILPGISGTSLLMLLGSWTTIINAISNITNINSLKTLTFFSIGIFIGTIIISKLLSYCFKKIKSITYSIILGISLSTTLSLILKKIKISNISQLLTTIILIITGYFISKIITKNK